jgi:hypothetical protein
MRAHNRVSRRQMLAMSAATGGVAVVSGFRGASAQVIKRIEQYAPELDSIISTSEPIQELATGTGGPLGPTEGPVWWKETLYLGALVFMHSFRSGHLGEHDTISH